MEGIDSCHAKQNKKNNKKKAKADTVFTSFVYSKKSVGSLYVGLESGAEIVVAPC